MVPVPDNLVDNLFGVLDRVPADVFHIFAVRTVVIVDVQSAEVVAVDGVAFVSHGVYLLRFGCVSLACDYIIAKSAIIVNLLCYKKIPQIDIAAFMYIAY